MANGCVMDDTKTPTALIAEALREVVAHSELLSEAEQDILECFHGCEVPLTWRERRRTLHRRLATAITLALRLIDSLDERLEGVLGERPILIAARMKSVLVQLQHLRKGQLHKGHDAHIQRDLLSTLDNGALALDAIILRRSEPQRLETTPHAPDDRGLSARDVRLRLANRLRNDARTSSALKGAFVAYVQMALSWEAECRFRRRVRLAAVKDLLQSGRVSVEGLARLDTEVACEWIHGLYPKDLVWQWVTIPGARSVDSIVHRMSQAACMALELQEPLENNDQEQVDKARRTRTWLNNTDQYEEWRLKVEYVPPADAHDPPHPAMRAVGHQCEIQLADRTTLTWMHLAGIHDQCSDAPQILVDLQTAIITEPAFANDERILANRSWITSMLPAHLSLLRRVQHSPTDLEAMWKTVFDEVDSVSAPQVSIAPADQLYPKLSALRGNAKLLWDALHGHLLSARELASPVYVNTSDAEVHNCVCEIRKLLGPDAIKTVQNCGYYRPDAPYPPGTEKKAKRRRGPRVSKR